MTIKKTQIEEKASAEQSGSKPTTGSGKGAFYPKSVSGIVEGHYVDDRGIEIQLTEDGAVKGGGGSSADEKAKISSADTTTGYLEDKVVAGTNITITKLNTGANEQLEISTGGAVGEANTASNLGTGESIFTTKSGVNLPFKSLKAGTNITLTPSGTEILIDAAGGSGAVDSVNTYTGIVVLDADDLSDAATTKKFTTAANLSKLAGIATGAQVNIALSNQAEAEAGTENTKTMTALRTAQAIAALGGGGSSVDEFKFTLPAAADLASRIAIVSGLPSGWALAPASTAGEAQFAADVDTLVMTWDSGLSTKIAQEITVFQITTGGPSAVQGVQKLDLTAAGKQKTNTTMTKAAVYLSGMGIDPTKDLIVFIKLI